MINYLVLIGYLLFIAFLVWFIRMLLTPDEETKKPPQPKYDEEELKKPAINRTDDI